MLKEEVKRLEGICSVNALDIKRTVDKLNELLKGKRVRLGRVWPKAAIGRIGVITYVSFFDGRLTYAMDILFRDGRGVLDNKASWVRSCWRREDFEFC